MQQAKNLVGWLAFITCIVMGVYLLLPGKESNNDVQELTQLEVQHINDSMLVDHYREKYLSAIDTIYAITVEKGQVEIERNRLEEKLKASLNNYKEKRVVKDTARAIIICDSIVYTYLPNYINIDSISHAYFDTLINFSTGVIGELYSTGDSIGLRLDTVGKQLIELKKENRQLKSENKVNKRKVLKAGFFGAAIGVLVTLISNFF